jgi:site-specific recombinase XerD
MQKTASARCGSIAIARGVRTETVAQNFGHASVATTSIYTHLDNALRYDEMETTGT